MANGMPGMRVPESLVERMRATSGPDAARAEGIAIAHEIAARVRGSVQGFQISTASGDIDAALAVVDGLRNGPDV
jgi:hypothetical protein